ncbi:hypothetical protein [Cellulomonas fimi]|uniref:hypothetical protein n=1 Tax=Cellulomonas fimi TaxID=1708 RepID=UPI0023597D2F|nr:hypothetical protein [Cellulomonas fimi]
MRWPWQRDRRVPPVADPGARPAGTGASAVSTPPGSGDAPTSAPAVTAPVARESTAGWAFLPPLQRTVGPVELTSRPIAFLADLPTRSGPRFTGPMTHVVDHRAPSGIVDGDGDRSAPPVQRSADVDLTVLPPAPRAAARVQRRTGGLVALDSAPVGTPRLRAVPVDPPAPDTPVTAPDLAPEPVAVPAPSGDGWTADGWAAPDAPDGAADGSWRDGGATTVPIGSVTPPAPTTTPATPARPDGSAAVQRRVGLGAPISRSPLPATPPDLPLVQREVSSERGSARADREGAAAVGRSAETGSGGPDGGATVARSASGDAPTTSSPPGAGGAGSPTASPPSGSPVAPPSTPATAPPSAGPGPGPASGDSVVQRSSGPVPASGDGVVQRSSTAPDGGGDPAGDAPAVPVDPPSAASAPSLDVARRVSPPSSDPGGALTAGGDRVSAEPVGGGTAPSDGGGSTTMGGAGSSIGDAGTAAGDVAAAPGETPGASGVGATTSPDAASSSGGGAPATGTGPDAPSVQRVVGEPSGALGALGTDPSSRTSASTSDARGTDAPAPVVPEGPRHPSTEALPVAQRRTDASAAGSGGATSRGPAPTAAATPSLAGRRDEAPSGHGGAATSPAPSASVQALSSASAPAAPSPATDASPGLPGTAGPGGGESAARRADPASEPDASTAAASRVDSADPGTSTVDVTDSAPTLGGTAPLTALDDADRAPDAPRPGATAHGPGAAVDLAVVTPSTSVQRSTGTTSEPAGPTASLAPTPPDAAPPAPGPSSADRPSTADGPTDAATGPTGPTGPGPGPGPGAPSTPTRTLHVGPLLAGAPVAVQLTVRPSPTLLAGRPAGRRAVPVQRAVLGAPAPAPERAAGSTVSAPALDRAPGGASAGAVVARRADGASHPADPVAGTGFAGPGAVASPPAAATDPDDAGPWTAEGGAFTVPSAPGSPAPGSPVPGPLTVLQRSTAATSRSGPVADAAAATARGVRATTDRPPAPLSPGGAGAPVGLTVARTTTPVGATAVGATAVGTTPVAPGRVGTPDGADAAPAELAVVQRRAERAPTASTTEPPSTPSTPPTVQRAEDAAPPPPPPAPVVAPDAASAAPESSGASPFAAATPADLDELARRLMTPLMRRVRGQLLVDRERRGTRIDR